MVYGSVYISWCVLTFFISAYEFLHSLLDDYSGSFVSDTCGELFLRYVRFL